MSRIFAMPFARVYPLYVQKVERKGRTAAEVDEVRRLLDAQGRTILGGDLEVELWQRQLNDDERQFLARYGTLSPGLRMQAMDYLPARQDENYCPDSAPDHELRSLLKAPHHALRQRPAQSAAPGQRHCP